MNPDFIALHRIVHGGDPLMPAVEALYHDAFVPAERRDSLLPCLGEPRLAVDAILSGGEFAGFICHWNFDRFIFIEHVATLPSLRGGGPGRAALLRIVERAPLCIAETDLESRDTLAARRVEFYRRLGFAVNPQPYVQPSYGAGKPSVPMHLLSRPRVLAPGEFAEITEEIRRVVYQ